MKDKTQIWLAIIFTAGEWSIAVYFLLSHGEVIMLWLACTYALRETDGGRHYHELVVNALKSANRLLKHS